MSDQGTEATLLEAAERAVPSNGDELTRFRRPIHSLRNGAALLVADPTRQEWRGYSRHELARWLREGGQW